MSVSITSPATAVTSRRYVGVWVAVAVALVAVAVVYARLRWPGALPFGSDNDEYRMVGAALSRFEPPVVAGVEGTKYPLGYPLVLALLTWLGLPAAPSALALNLVALAAAVLGITALVGRATATGAPLAGIAGVGPALAAGGVVVTSAAVWNDVFSVMPELLLVAVVVAILWTVADELTPRRLVALTVLAVVAVTFKTLAALAVGGGCAVLWLVTRQVRALAPAVAAVAAVLAGMLVTRAYPEHTTGYLATFPLVDPDDASQGRLGLGGLIARTVADLPDTFTDLGRAAALIDAGTEVAVIVAIVALTLGVVGAHRLRPGTPLGPFVAGATLAYAFGLAAWPYHSSRFGLPLVPVAALGVGWAVHAIATRASQRWVAPALGVAVLAALVVTSIGAVADRGDRGSAELARQHAAVDELAAWAATDLADGDRLVSFDYREVARVLDRTVSPIGYTSDIDDLWAQVEGADVLVALDVYGKRTVQVDALLVAHADRFEERFTGDDVRVYDVRG